MPDPQARATVESRLLRDLTSLLALPALWNGTEPAFVLRTFFEAIESVLQLDVCYGDASVGATRLELLRIGRHPARLDDPAGHALRAFALAEPAGESSRSLEIRGELVHCRRLAMGYVWDHGRIVVGASRVTFPDQAELITLRAGLSLAVAGLETARLIHERDEAQRAKDEFLAMLGHELRNPLTPIVTAVQLLSAKAGSVPSPELEVIDRQLRHLRRLVDDLLDISRITKGRIDLAIERLDLADLVARALETVAPMLERAGHELVVQVPAGLAIDADPMRMMQVLTNLLTNAIKYTPPGGRIRVAGESRAGHIVLRVVDNGTGLSPELLPRVFDLFVQGRRNLARAEGGLGIGLAIVKQLVVAHGGRVAAVSNGPGCGSEFVIDLPQADGVAPSPHVEPLHTRSAAHVGARVLLVDDNQDAADLAALVLGHDGHDVAVAYTGAQALEVARAHEPDVVVLDIGLPDLDGYEVAARLTAQHPDAPPRIVALTGYGRPQDRVRSAAIGFTAHLVKPVDPEQLRVAVRHAHASPARAGR